jgi:hypothetical protein
MNITENFYKKLIILIFYWSHSNIYYISILRLFVMKGDELNEEHSYADDEQDDEDNESVNMISNADSLSSDSVFLRDSLNDELEYAEKQCEKSDKESDEESDEEPGTSTTFFNINSERELVYGDELETERVIKKNKICSPEINLLKQQIEYENNKLTKLNSLRCTFKNRNRIEKQKNILKIRLNILKQRVENMQLLFELSNVFVFSLNLNEATKIAAIDRAIALIQIEKPIDGIMSSTVLKNHVVKETDSDFLKILKEKEHITPEPKQRNLNPYFTTTKAKQFYLDDY